ncbi:MAG: hypothetical protein LUG16_08450, partial [Candidatus Gastranaerophilales bacterium]|nr:hypothetical protein [Candidatus Gastranaerophilales bacterium]
DFVYYISPTLDALSLEFRKYGILTTYTYVLSALPQLQNLEKELDCMDTILSLNFNNEFIVTERFKKAYDRKLKQIYTTHVKGEYNLSKNLSITNRQLLYTLTDKERKGKQV